MAAPATCPPAILNPPASPAPVPVEAVSSPLQRPKKRRKKLKYKELMTSITHRTEENSKSDEEIRKLHSSQISKSVGGGAFSKLDRI